MITGSIVAIVTPMHEDGSLDLQGLRGFAGIEEFLETKYIGVEI